jgi:dipeptidase E
MKLLLTRLPVPAYAIDDETAVKVIDGAVEVVSEGRWKLFNSGSAGNPS